MKNLHINTNPEVELVFNNYPDLIRKKILYLKSLVLEAAGEMDGISILEETLKWGEPSYLAKNGSIIRIDWKKNKPDQYAIYFKCTSKLVPTFKMINKDIFRFEGNRAIIFQLEDEIPKVELKNCITASLTYHKVKHLPTLGM
jgi:hypothetical protein